ncbi:hypothetical protein CIHG_08854 [Coccidioides immitis H538.4]|uniref:Uncharacterized protein n=2 Tax=Coccidioides immitis TaxID=5501 RepID=A0A0J8R1R6_COCIT|nr:hypothetical protein CISG_01355 [Coccidioides immitis RMSCC 3703]KMU90999.1 hypothetical protein CIHG_08854 [Coccidioides immitis H538.4]
MAPTPLHLLSDNHEPSGHYSESPSPLSRTKQKKGWLFGSLRGDVPESAHRQFHIPRMAIHEYECMQACMRPDGMLMARIFIFLPSRSVLFQFDLSSLKDVSFHARGKGPADVVHGVSSMFRFMPAAVTERDGSLRVYIPRYVPCSSGVNELVRSPK